jgi:intein/homing endonuclease
MPAAMRSRRWPKPVRRRHLTSIALVVGLLSPTPGWAMVGYGTFVTLADDTMRVVQALRRGDKLAGPDGKQREIFAISIVEGAELILVTTNTGRKIVLSKDHPVPVERNDSPFIANGVRLGDKIMSIEGFETVEYIEPAKAGTVAYKLSIGEPGTTEKDPLFANGLMVSDEPI